MQHVNRELQSFLVSNFDFATMLSGLALLFGADQDSETILVEGEIEEELQQKLRWVKICLQNFASISVCAGNLVSWKVFFLFACAAGFEATQ